MDVLLKYGLPVLMYTKSVICLNQRKTPGCVQMHLSALPPSVHSSLGGLQTRETSVAPAMKVTPNGTSLR